MSVPVEQAERPERIRMKKTIILSLGVLSTACLISLVPVQATSDPISSGLVIEDIIPVSEKEPAESWLMERGVIVPDEIRFECEAAGACFSVCPELLEALCWQESRFISTAKSGNCIGLMQINHKTHADRLAAYGADTWSVHSQIWTAASLLRDFALEYAIDGEPAEASVILAAYHGESDVYKEPSYYTRTILEISAQLERSHGK